MVLPRMSLHTPAVVCGAGLPSRAWPRRRAARALAALLGIAWTVTVLAAAPRPDFDGNGTTDLLWRNSVSGQTTIWLMSGTSPAATATIISDPTWQVTALGDFNGDGKTDLVWHNSVSGQTAIWLMNGVGVSSSGFVMSDPNWAVTATGDFNGDGKTDLVWRNGATGQTAIWLMNGLAAATSAFVMNDPNWVAAYTADFNGDGRTDLLWRNSATGQTVIWLMNGANVSASAFVMNNPTWAVTATGDFNGDGRADLVWRNSVTGQTALWLMNGTTAQASAFVMTDPSWSVSAAADLNGDSRSDLVWTNSVNGQVAVWLMNGVSATSSAVVLADPAWTLAQVADTNGDSRADLVFRNAVNGQTAVWLMNGVAPSATSIVLSDPAWSLAYDAGIYGYRSAARLLAHATFGSSRDEIVRVNAIGPDAWLNEQFGKPRTSFTGYVYPMLTGGMEEWEVNSAAIWRQLFQGDDQLRMRATFALSQILVISLENNTVQDAYCGPTSYLDLLADNAFGNFQDLLKGVAQHPVMGEYLNMKGSAKNDAISGQIPNENFAREMLQLFSIGTVMLNPDASLVKDANGKPVPTYDQAVVQSFAKAYSGWTFAGQDQTKSWRWLYPDIWDTDHLTRVQKACPAWSQPMQPWLAPYRAADNTRDIAGPAHDTGAKQLLAYPNAVNGMLAAGQTPQQDIDGAVANIFNHPNVGPFIGRQLIQRLVTSNPSPAYVQRVASAFNNNGSGVRGDMKAVWRAILRDPEAVGMPFVARAKWGRLREPIVRFVQAHRAFKSVINNAQQYYQVWDLTDSSDLAQDVLRAPSVFNFYSPHFAPSTAFGADGSAAPEFQITTTDSVAGYSDFSKWGIIGGFRSWEAGVTPSYWIKPDYSYYTGIAANATQLVEELDLLMAEGMLDPGFKRALIASIGKIGAGNASGRDERFKTALWLLLNTPDGLVQK